LPKRVRSRDITLGQGDCHAVLRKRRHPHPLRGGRLRLSVAGHPRRRIEFDDPGLATSSHPFNPFDEFKDEFRVIAADLRNAKGGQSSGPLETDRAWDAFTDDHIGLMDHLGIREFLVLGFCIGGPFIWNLLKRAGDRVVAAVPAQPSGFRPEMPTLSYDNNMKTWGPELCARRPDITMEMVDAFLTNMYRARADFVYSVTRDFVAAARHRSWCYRTTCRRTRTRSRWKPCASRLTRK